MIALHCIHERGHERRVFSFSLNVWSPAEVDNWAKLSTYSSHMQRSLSSVVNCIYVSFEYLNKCLESLDLSEIASVVKKSQPLILLYHIFHSD